MSSETEQMPSERQLFISLQPKQTGITFQNTLTSTPQLNILNYIYYYNGGGVATGDFNNDGLSDLYFTANQSADVLYLNQGKLEFKDISKAAGIDNKGNWTTGVTTVDINNDGLLDIYVCKVANYQNIEGHNLLYLNMGVNDQGIPTFEEKSKSFGLDFQGFSTQAGFFDYDLDGDLDLYLLNHSTNPNQNYGRGSQRNTPNSESGDKLFENKNGTFENVSEEAGILQSKIGYGLGLSISDLNNDGYPDIYVGNDFFENDYLYLNQKDKTFEEMITTKSDILGHTTHFSMGNDIADINNDGYTDILSVDMLPEDIKTYKTSGSEFNYSIYQNYLNNGYTPQYMQNTLQLNNGNESFSETAYLSGVAATEWSWSPLMADFNNDGLLDIHITNGILGATNDMDFINFISNDLIQKSLGSGMTEKEMALITKIPQKKTKNYFFRNNGNNQFNDVSSDWSDIPTSYSNGSVYVDLDNDGDLDIVTNNVNEPAFVLENTSSSNFLTVSLLGSNANRLGIGARVICFKDSLQISRENYTTRGYQSAVAPILHFGLDAYSTLDSLQVIWPDKTYQTLIDITSNQKIVLDQKNASGDYYKLRTEKVKQFLTNIPPLFEFTHKENTTIDFNRNPLIAFAMSNEGPDISVTDVNNDGLEDVFISGGKRQASQLLVQQKGGTFHLQQRELFELDALNEDIAHIFFDANRDTYQDLLIVSAGNEFFTGPAISPRIYHNNKGVFVKDINFMNGDFPINASNVKAMDLDGDGDMDVCISSALSNSPDGTEPSQLLLNNTGNGEFLISEDMGKPHFANKGKLNDLLYVDVDGDGSEELVTLGDWAPISIYDVHNGSMVRQEDNGLENTRGLWNTIEAGDFDNDGDIDLVAGNWGLNSRLQASIKEPITLYNYDFDANGSNETLITYFYKGEETAFVSKDELVKQLPGLNKKYLSYHDFANATVPELFGKEKIDLALKEYVTELASCYFENDGQGKFTRHKLPFSAQISSVNDIHVEDFNNDGFLDMLLVGNNFEISTQLSSLDASHGVLLLNDSNGNFNRAKGQEFNIPGASRNIAKLGYQDNDYLIITRNNDQPVFLRINK